MAKSDKGKMIIILSIMMLIGWFIFCFLFATLGIINLGLEEYSKYHGMVIGIFCFLVIIGSFI